MGILKKLYDKSEITFAIIWIVAYCVLMSVGDSLSATLGIAKSVTLAVGILLSAILFAFIKKNGLLKKYGFCLPQESMRRMLYYIPVAVLLTANLWHGVTLNYNALETVLYILSMFCVGFLEEVIFRGLLFVAMLKENVKAAIIVSSITFGMGHILNLINGSGAQLVPNLLQVIYATAAGFMFVMVYYRTKSIFICIVTHALFNALSAFSDESALTMTMHIITCILLTAITGGYASYIAFTMRKNAKLK